MTWLEPRPMWSVTLPHLSSRNRYRRLLFNVHPSTLLLRLLTTHSINNLQDLGNHAPIVPTKILGDPEELERHLNRSGADEYNQRRDNGSIFGPNSDLDLLVSIVNLFKTIILERFCELIRINAKYD